MKANFTPYWVRGALGMLLAVCFSLSAEAQNQVSGTVTSVETSEALPGVNVIVKGTTVGTVTDIDGNYSIDVPEGQNTLQFSFIGFTAEEVEINDQSTINVGMAPDIQSLEEVVVQAYGQESERLNVQQVETVQADRFRDFPVVSPQEVLQGQAPGIQVTGSSGVIGTAQNVRIRGVASINAGTQPLYVVDGVPLNDASGGAENYSDAAGGASLNPLIDINPNDIESINVLKDASAVALYGSRGANGVILITTKKGAQGEKTQFNFDYFTGWSEPSVLKDALSPDQWRQFRSDFLTARGTPTVPADLPQESFNWLDAVIQTGRTNSYSLSARGGTEKTAFYVGGTFLDQEGYQIGNAIDKLNGRFNLSHEANDKVRLGFNLSVSRLNNDRFFQENSTGSPLTVGYLQLPFVLPTDENGVFQNVGFGNPIGEQQLNTFEYISRRLTGNVYAEFEPIAGLVFRTDWGTDQIQTETTQRNADVFSPGGFAGKEIVQDDKWLTTNTASYSFDIADVHQINVLAGFSYETAERNDIEVSTQDFVSDLLPTVAAGATPNTTEATATEWALASTFGRVNYNYNDRYILEGNLRRDGSSRFGANNRYGTFWALSGGWLVSSEDFFPENNVVNFLKLTASYGIAGNDRVDNFESLGLFAANRNYNGAPGIEASQPANPNLTWEETAQLDISLSTRFFDDRLRLDASWYRKETTELLLEFQLPTTTGFASRFENAGSMVNRGIDLSLGGDVIVGDNFSWTLTGNVGFLRNEITSLPGAAVDPLGDPFVAQAAFSSQRAVVGRSAYEFFLIRYRGVNPQTGDPEWLNKDGEIINSPTSDDRVYVGSALPDFTGGITSTMRYKGLEFSVFANFVKGGKTYLADNEFSNNIVASGGFNLTTDVLDYWRAPGDNSFAPNLGSDFIARFDDESTLHLFDASYVRIKNIRLAYNLPASTLESVDFLRSVRVYVQGQNAFTLFSALREEGSDPEINNGGTDSDAQAESFFTSPQARTITIGVSLGL